MIAVPSHDIRRHLAVSRALLALIQTIHTSLEV